MGVEGRAATTGEGGLRFLQHPRRGGVVAAALVTATIGVGLAACADDDDAQPTSSTPIETTSSTRIAPPPATTSDMTSTPAPGTTTAAAPEPPSTEVVTIYLADDKGDLVPVQLDTQGGVPLVSAIEALADPPASAGQPAALPFDTTVRSVRAEGGVATIDLSRQFVDFYPSGGSAAEAALLGPIVFTATEFDNVDGVLIVVEGATPEPIGSAYDFSAPLTRQDIPVTVVPSP